jgi:DNA-binding CsgD family transcriptional regulator
LDESALEAVISEVYEAAALANADQWRSVLHRLAEACGAEAVLLLPGQDAPVGAKWSVGADEFVEFGLRNGWYAQNPRVSRGTRVIRGSQDILTEDRLFTARELDHLPFNGEFVNRFGMRSFAGLIFAPEGPASVYLSIERRRDQGRFESTELAALSRALPHLQRAGRLASNVGDAHARGVLDAANALRCGAILLDRAARVVNVSEKAERHLGHAGESTLKLAADGSLLAHDRAANVELQRLIGTALNTAVRATVSVSTKGGGAVALPRLAQAIASGGEGQDRRLPLVISAAPVLGAGNDVFQRAKVILTITDPEERIEPTEALVRSAFGLTEAEARVAIALQQGSELSDIARGFSVSAGTVRTQLKAIFAKTGTHRQSDLVGLLARMART